MRPYHVVPHNIIYNKYKKYKWFKEKARQP